MLSFREIDGYNLDRHASDKGTYKASSLHSSTVGGDVGYELPYMSTLLVFFSVDYVKKRRVTWNISKSILCDTMRDFHVVAA